MDSIVVSLAFIWWNIELNDYVVVVVVRVLAFGDIHGQKLVAHFYL
jgi:hypothetical protein